MGFKIVTWNINGLRSFGNAPTWRKVFADFEADLVCLQETKINRSAVEEWMAVINDYTSYFAFPRGQLQTSGYSGVATFCRESNHTRPSGAEISLFLDSNEIFPKKTKAYEFDELDEEYRFSIRWPSVYDRQTKIGLPPSQLGANMWKLVDSEGRCVVTKHAFSIDGSDSSKNLFIFNVYCPRNDCTRPERQHFQLRFYHMLEKRALQLLSDSPDNFVIITGDFNTTHLPIDVYDDEKWDYARSYSRKWLDELLTKADSGGAPLFFDAFRHLNPEEQKSFTCWNVKLGCRVTNFGSRLDYIIIDHKLLPHLLKCYPLTHYLGSDHCPVVAEFDDRIRFSKQDQFSEHCTRMWPEFGLATQTPITNFFPSGSREMVHENMQKSTTKRSVQEDEAKPNSPNKKAKSGQATLRNYFQPIKVKAHESDQNESATVSKPEETKIKSPNESNISDVSPLDSGIHRLSTERQQSQSAKWAELFWQEPTPNCTGHNLPSVIRIVKKPGPNFGRKFYACSKTSIGPAGHPESRCDFFRWLVDDQLRKV